jgi:transcriptional regulator with XRE-family HTH domain
MATVEDLELVDDPFELFKLSTAAITERQAEIDKLATIRMRSLAALYANGISYRELANMLGMTGGRVNQLVNSNEAASLQVLKAWVAVEKTMTEIGRAAGLKQSVPTYQRVRKILFRSRYIDQAALNDLDELRRTRNAVTHGSWDVSEEEASRLADKAIYLNALLTLALGEFKEFRYSNDSDAIYDASEDIETTGAFEDDAATARRAEKVLEQLNAALDRLVSEGSIEAKPSTSERVFHLAYGWWAFMVRSGNAVLALRRYGLEHEASPIVRTVLQHGLVLQWLVDTGDSAVDSIEQDADANVRLLLKTMAASDWPPVAGLTMTPPPMPQVRNSSVEKLRNFAALCRDYNAYQLYVPFRLLSAYVHPTSVGAMAYLDEQTGNLSPVALSTSNALVIQTAMCLIQASKAFGQLLAKNSLRDAVMRAESTLGIEVAMWSRGELLTRVVTR